MRKSLWLVSLLSMIAVSAHADDQARLNAERIVELKDGSTLYVFRDAKMAMRDAKGNALDMAPGHPMQTTNGETIIMVGNEVARLNNLIKHGHQGAWSREAR